MAFFVSLFVLLYRFTAINIHIEEAKLHHISAIAECWQEIDIASEAPRPFGGDSGGKLTHVENILKHTIQSKDARVLLALDEQGTIVGTISGHVFDKPAVNISRVGVLYSLWVHAAHRRQGIGLQLLNTLEAQLIEKGAQAFQVGWDVGNDNAAAWWQRRGYLSYEVIASKIPETHNT